MTTAHPYREIVGRPWIGYPGSEVLKVWPVVNEDEAWAQGSPPVMVEIRLADGREIRLPSNDRNILRNLGR